MYVCSEIYSHLPCIFVVCGVEFERCIWLFVAHLFECPCHISFIHIKHRHCAYKWQSGAVYHCCGCEGAGASVEDSIVEIFICSKDIWLVSSMMHYLNYLGRSGAQVLVDSEMSCGAVGASLSCKNLEQFAFLHILWIEEHGTFKSVVWRVAIGGAIHIRDCCANCSVAHALAFELAYGIVEDVSLCYAQSCIVCGGFCTVVVNSQVETGDCLCANVNYLSTIVIVVAHLEISVYGASLSHKVFCLIIRCDESYACCSESVAVDVCPCAVVVGIAVSLDVGGEIRHERFVWCANCFVVSYIQFLLVASYGIWGYIILQPWYSLGDGNCFLCYQIISSRIV